MSEQINWIKYLSLVERYGRAVDEYEENKKRLSPEMREILEDVETWSEEEIQKLHDLLMDQDLSSSMDSS